jgi:hypothetical protein
MFVFGVAAAVATVVACGVLAKMAAAARAYLSGIGCGTGADARFYQQASERGAGRKLAF